MESVALSERWRYSEISPEEQLKREAKNQQELQRFREFLKDPKNAEAIQAAIDRINREAGFEPEDPGEQDGASPKADDERE